MSAPSQRLRVTNFGQDGLRIACREGTVDEQAIQPWLACLEEPVPRPHEPPPDAVILDVGAHIGGFTLLAASLAPKGKVLAVEASRGSYDMLVHNIELNELKQVEASHLALAEQAGEVQLHSGATGNWGNSITRQNVGNSEIVPAATLTSYLEEHAVQHCDLAKFNCEGAEFQILIGSPIETLRKLHKMIVFYHGDFVSDPEARTKLERHLQEAGFELGERGGGKAHGFFIAELAG